MVTYRLTDEQLVAIFSKALSSKLWIIGEDVEEQDVETQRVLDTQVLRPGPYPQDYGAVMNFDTTALPGNKCIAYETPDKIDHMPVSIFLAGIKDKHRNLTERQYRKAIAYLNDISTDRVELPQTSFQVAAALAMKMAACALAFVVSRPVAVLVALAALAVGTAVSAGEMVLGLPGHLLGVPGLAEPVVGTAIMLGGLGLAAAIWKASGKFKFWGNSSKDVSSENPLVSVTPTPA